MSDEKGYSDFIKEAKRIEVCMTSPKKLKTVSGEWAPKTIYLTRDGWNDNSDDEGREVLWREDRIMKTDVEYRRVERGPLKPKKPLRRRK